MRQWIRGLSRWGLSVVVIGGVGACAAKAPTEVPAAAPQAYEETPVPTVPPRTPTPEPTAAPLRTRPIGKQVKATKGRPIGPLITHFGAARADGMTVEPQSVDKNGIPTYVSSAGSGFWIIVEAKPGESGHEVARRVFAYVPNDPNVRPDLEIESSRDMGDGSRVVCDARKPNLGGIPGIHPANFAMTQRISDAINDFACRFETAVESQSACTLTTSGDYAFVNGESTTQFCMSVARLWSFPVGDTVLTVRVRDSEGNPGPIKQMRIRRPSEPKPAK